jgi:hypothetical protein
VGKVAQSMGISCKAVKAWKDPLSAGISDRVVGATLRTEGLSRAMHWFPQYFKND